MAANAIANVMHAQISPSRRGSASAAHPTAINHWTLGLLAASGRSRPAHSARAPAVTNIDGLIVANTDHAIGVSPTRMAVVASGRLPMVARSAHATNPVATAAPNSRAHHNGTSPGMRPASP